MPDPLDLRLMKSFQDFLGTPIAGAPTVEAARAAMAALAFRKRDEDLVITPETDTAKGIRFIAAATDMGRTVKYGPIRNLWLDLQLRGNRLADLGKSDPFNAACGNLELLLNQTNLKLALDSSAREIRVMLAVRSQGNVRAVINDIVTYTSRIEVKAVGTESCEG